MRWYNPVETEDGLYKILASPPYVSPINNNMILEDEECLFICNNEVQIFFYSFANDGHYRLYQSDISIFLWSASYLITTKKLAVEFYLKFG